MNKKQYRFQKGFTLIEMITVLVLVSILAAGAGLGIVAGVQGYLFSKDNAVVSEKVQLAIARINRELMECYDCKGTSGAVADHFNNTLGERCIRKNGNNIEIGTYAGGSCSETDILIDNVDIFSMIYNADNSITVTIGLLTKPGGVTIPAFTNNVYPRNIQF